MPHHATRLLPALALATLLVSAPSLFACEPTPCRGTATTYARDLAPISLSASASVQLPIILLAPRLPSGPTLLDFGLLHCAAAPVTSGPDTRAAGSYRLLTSDGAMIDGTTSMLRTMQGWCLTEQPVQPDALASIPTTAWQCDGGGCTAHLRVEIVPSVNIAADEIELRLHDGANACGGTSFAEASATIEQFGP